MLLHPFIGASESLGETSAFFGSIRRPQLLSERGPVRFESFRSAPQFQKGMEEAQQDSHLGEDGFESRVGSLPAIGGDRHRRIVGIKSLCLLPKDTICIGERLGIRLFTDISPQKAPVCHRSSNVDARSIAARVLLIGNQMRG